MPILGPAYYALLIFQDIDEMLCLNHQLINFHGLAVTTFPNPSICCVLYDHQKISETKEFSSKR